jgi:hypothetical protein
MNVYLKKITKETCIEVKTQRIMGQNLNKINKHFLQSPYKTCLNRINHLIHDKLIYHRNVSDFFPRYFNIHLANTLLVNDMPYITYLNLPFNAIFVESYEYAPKEVNYLMKTLFP